MLSAAGKPAESKHNKNRLQSLTLRNLFFFGKKRTDCQTIANSSTVKISAAYGGMELPAPCSP